MQTADWALVISLISVTLALASFVWNVWSKFIYPKPKVRTSFSVMRIFQEGEEPSDPFLTLSATNYGPGPITLSAAVTRSRGNRLSKSRIGLLNPLHNFPRDQNMSVGPFSGGLPKKIDVGESFSAYFVFRHEAIRDEPIIDVGFNDTFGRNHWAPRRDVRKVRKAIREKFPKEQLLHQG